MDGAPEARATRTVLVNHNVRGRIVLDTTASQTEKRNDHFTLRKRITERANDREVKPLEELLGVIIWKENHKRRVKRAFGTPQNEICRLRVALDQIGHPGRELVNADVDGKHTRVANGLLFGKVVINDARDVGDPLKRHDGLVAQNALQVLRGFARYTPSWFCVDAVMQCVTRDHGEVQIQPSLQYSAVMRTAEFVQMCVTRRRCNADRPVVRKT